MNHKGPRLVVAVAAVAAAAGLLTAGAGAAPAAFTDPAGDAGTAPDITNVALSAANGSVTIAVTATALSAGQSIDIFLNTDKNDSTGSPGGSEFDVEVWQDVDDWGWDMASWSGSDWKETPQNPAEHFSRSGNLFTWTFPMSEIGGTSGFTFTVAGIMIDAGGTITGVDRAPDGGTWVYDIATPPPPVAPVIGKPHAVPAVPHAGALLSLAFPVTPATAGTVAASVTLAGKPVPKTATLANGTAQLAVALPKSAKGKTLRVKVTVTVGGMTATRTVSFVVH